MTSQLYGKGKRTSFPIVPVATLAALVLVALSAVVSVRSDLTIREQRAYLSSSTSADPVVRASPSAADALPKQLAAIHDAIEIRPAQEPAWHRFAEQMTDLEGLTRSYERRLSAGEKVDRVSERATHTLSYGAAMNAISERLSTRQTAVLARMGRDLARTAVCRELSADRRTP